MYADRYSPRPVNRGSLALSVSIVGGLVAAVMLSPTVVSIVDRHRPSEPVWVLPSPPPPPPDSQPKVERRSPTQPTRVDQPRTIVPTTLDPSLYLPPDPGPAADLPALEGTGTGVAVDPPKPPSPPVLVDARPDPRASFQPPYPAEERRAGNEGVVTIRVLVGVDGRVREVERVAAPSDAFWRVTQAQALGRWRFSPATRDGVPYESWRTMTVRFRLEAD